MLDQPTPTTSPATELRCPCGKLMATLLDDFDGFVSLPCRRCKAEVRSEALGDNDAPDRRIDCVCGRWLLTGVILGGIVRVQCQRCGLMHVGAQGAEVFVPRRGRGPAQQDQRGLPLDPSKLAHRRANQTKTMRERHQAALVALIEDRWKLMRLDRVHRSTDLAVGLRFDVFNRDRFRCRYCGRGPEQGVMLEADHVVPRAEGGPDTIANLVTACWDCNRGKSAKPLAV